MKTKIVSEATTHDAEFEVLPAKGDKITLTDAHEHFQYEVTQIEHVVNDGKTDISIHVKENQMKRLARGRIDPTKLA